MRKHFYFLECVLAVALFGAKCISSQRRQRHQRQSLRHEEVSLFIYRVNPDKLTGGKSGAIKGNWSVKENSNASIVANAGQDLTCNDKIRRSRIMAF